ncbi:hypothetical protein [uncultured Bradyrhizobium sp.]|uniref:hypothetical protein n=1 Tax=uncultured Bradyrhizobium sp. TaxID=199684 RepID=UPI0035CA4E89
MTMIERLLELANTLAENGAHSLTLKRRAVSTAYYAVFHALAKLCADELLQGRGSNEYERVYRALDHGTLKTAFKNKPLNQIPEIVTIGNRAVELQSERMRSDYLPSQRLYTKNQCLDLVHSARIAVRSFGRLSAEQRRTLAVHLLFKNRQP